MKIEKKILNKVCSAGFVGCIIDLSYQETWAIMATWRGVGKIWGPKERGVQMKTSKAVDVLRDYVLI